MQSLFKPETGLAFASLSLALIFIFYFISLFIVFTKPLDIGTTALAQQAWQKIFIGMTVFGFPNIGLSIATYILAKRNALKIVSIVLIVQGIVIIAGMADTLSISANFIDEYKLLNMEMIPQAFLIAGIIPLGLGIHLFTLKPQKRSRFFTQ
ncbi:MAG: hypothetical protein D6752_05345 [Candidatus Nitrosothermus koennekii]|nr:MAG: hypothetical protein D6752_05345 [Candidatus Nitrosothermus koennekii]